MGKIPNSLLTSQSIDTHIPDTAMKDIESILYELWSDIVTKIWIVTDSLIKVTKPDGTIVCPYIFHRRGRTFINEGDYIIIDEDGTKHVCGEDKIFTRYEPVSLDEIL